MSLKYEVAKMICDSIELGLFEGIKSSFDYDDDCDPEIQHSQEYYLKLADKVIKKVKRSLKK
jgi:hypothetical protein